jgi:hypothetical protein
VDRSETGSKSEPHHRLEFLIKLTSAKTDALEKALEKTWIAHVVVAGLGFAMVLNVGQVLQAIAGRYLPGASDLKTVAPIMLAIYLYYFMKTGPLLTAFNEAKSLRDQLLKNYLKGQPEEGKVAPLHETSNFLAAAFYDDLPGLVPVGGPWWRRKFVKWLPYFFITDLVVSLAQAAALFLMFEAYHASAMFWLVIVIVSVLLIALYIMFWKGGHAIRGGDAKGAEPGKAQREQTRRRLAVVALLGSVILWLFLFTRLHRDRRGAPYFFSGNQLSRGSPFISRDAL